MEGMGEQFLAIIQPRLEKVNREVAPKTAKAIDQRMKENTEAGHGFGNDPYEANYSRSRARQRRKLGLQTEKVDLRAKKRRIEQTRVEKVGGGKGGAKIAFNDGGDIFKLHHDGTAKGNKIRSIFPKAPESIPEDIKLDSKQDIKRVLSGQG